MQEPLNIETIAEDPPLIEIRSMDFIGSVAPSENLSFAVAFADSCRTENGSLRGGSRMCGEGDALLIKEKWLVWQKKIPRPVHARVSNTGIAAVCDIGFGPDLRSNILVFREDGSTAVSQVIEANLMSCAMTAGGDFVFFNSLGSSNPEHSVKLFAYVLPSGEHAFTVDFLIQELTGAVSDGDKLTVTAEGISYEYSRSGALLNKLEANLALFDRNLSSGYFASAHRVVSDCLKDVMKDEQRETLRAAYERLISSDSPSEIKAKAHRDLGEQWLAQGDKAQALAEFREALRLNSGIGLKRKVAELEKVN
jgi:hypothetical protein